MVGQEEAILVKVEKAAKMIDMGRTKMYSMIAHDGLPVHRFGSSVRIDPIELRAWLKERRKIA
jgi:excisionase family DNA binding protein